MTFAADLERFVEQEVASGRFSNREAVIDHALRLLQREREEAVAGIQAGLAMLRRERLNRCASPSTSCVASVMLVKSYDLRRRPHSEREEQLAQLLRTCCQRAPATAARWLDRFEQALDSLAVNPQRCGLAPENDLVDIEVRQLLFGKRPHTYRALFTVDGDQVQVLHVRRATMDNATADDLFSPDVE